MLEKTWSCFDSHLLSSEAEVTAHVPQALLHCITDQDFSQQVFHSPPQLFLWQTSTDNLQEFVPWLLVLCFTSPGYYVGVNQEKEREFSA